TIVKVVHAARASRWRTSTPRRYLRSGGGGGMVQWSRSSSDRCKARESAPRLDAEAFRVQRGSGGTVR
ncbi:hypothetical protein K438DRAFT_1864021, partial [Mycena galopus ATCC 62051]